APYLKSIYVLAIRSRRPSPAFPLEAAGAIAAPLVFGIGLYCMVPARDDAGLAQLQATLDGCLQRCLALGGRPYLYGAHRIERAVADATYGADYQRLRALRHELDPGALLGAERLP